MKTDETYDKLQPLIRLEKGDAAVIRIDHSVCAREKDTKKYEKIPTGEYAAVCTDFCKLQCDEQPLLSGRYNCWYGDKWGCSEDIYADETPDQKLL